MGGGLLVLLPRTQHHAGERGLVDGIRVVLGLQAERMVLGKVHRTKCKGDRQAHVLEEEEPSGVFSQLGTGESDSSTARVELASELGVGGARGKQSGNSHLLLSQEVSRVQLHARLRGGDGHGSTRHRLRDAVLWDPHIQ